jgi:A/G-specific adenine glycosylase
MIKITPKKFQNQVLTWFDAHGRKHLPWQENKTPYRVWISEIMLQQTQVSTVIPYFERFMQRFPDIKSLAIAQEDEVLHLWTGLGYYTRARNLHRSAKIIHYDYSGHFPNTLNDIEKLPGIGRSTAGAIFSIAFQQPAAILDGNVKRVLTRFHAILAWPGEKKAHDYLWQLAEKYTPQQRTADYAQAMMDLGATLCTRGKPNCVQCPLKKSCSALAQGLEKKLPRSKPKKILPVRLASLLLIKNKNRILLFKRPPTGIWGGLWTPPDLTGHVSLDEIKKHCRQYLKLQTDVIHKHDVFRHTFSHFHLDILPVVISVKKLPSKLLESEQQIWYNLQASQTIGLPAPVKKLLRLHNDTHD